MMTDTSSEHNQHTAPAAGSELYTVRLPEEGVHHIIGALGVMSGMTTKQKYENTMNAVQYQYDGTESDDNSE